MDAAKQLMILLAFVAGGVPDQKRTTISEELALESYGALAALFKDLTASPGGAASLVETNTIPALGHCVTVILDGITDGSSVEVQLQGLRALDTVWRCLKDLQALATFLPGTISCLTKFLMPGTASRRSRKNLTIALEVLENVLVSVLSDIRTRTIRDKLSEDPVASSAEQKVLTKSWLKATAAQIKLALSNIIRLRKHEGTEVREALSKLCLTILDECHDTLSESASLLVETSMILDGVVEDQENLRSRRTTLTDLASIHLDIGELVKSTSYNWVTSLPRIMQSNDVSAKDSALEQLSKANQLLRRLNSDSSILEDALGSSLRDSITVTLDESPASKGLEEADFDMNSQAALTLVTDNADSTQFRPVILGQQSQRNTRKRLAELLTSLGTRESQTNMAGEMLEYTRGATGPSLLATYWLSFQILKASASENEDIDEFFDSALTLSDEQETMNQELMSFSQSILASNDGEYDWRMQATALEVVADRAQRLKESFRPELIDTLYPVAQLLGSPNERLRHHAITSLNIISKSCGYTNASNLIADNVDYMVNAISLRLNTFDISPQAPQVLVMMIRLAGPSLLLYLDDVVSSIFAALDNFHGYQRLVEVLFSVLDEIVKVGSTAPQFQITTSTTPKTPEPKPPTITDIAALLTPKPASPPSEPEPFPRTPWKSATTLLDEAAAAAADPPSPSSTDQDQEQEEPPPPQDPAPAPPTKTHALLQLITSHSQHHLTTSSPHLRLKLLSLITTSAAALSHNQDTFLPLINDIWPVVVARIYDPEIYVAVAAMDAVSHLCKTAGEFMRSRMASEMGGMLKLAQRTKIEAEKEKRGRFGEAGRRWEAVVRLLCVVVEEVGVQEEGVFGELVKVLGEEVWEREGVMGALGGERGNAGWVWLVCYLGGRERVRERPGGVEGREFVGLG